MEQEKEKVKKVQRPRSFSNGSLSKTTMGYLIFNIEAFEAKPEELGPRFWSKAPSNHPPDAQICPSPRSRPYVLSDLS